MKCNFKVGDRVIFTHEGPFSSDKIGKIGVVLSLVHPDATDGGEDWVLRIQFDDGKKGSYYQYKFKLKNKEPSGFSKWINKVAPLDNK